MDRLSARLESLYAMITGRVCADIGTDHALLPCFLVKDGKCTHAFACDIRQGPLNAARKNIEKFGLTDRIETMLCDGIDPELLKRCDTVVIAGMGGDMIADILKRANMCAANVQFVLQPMTKIPSLRRYLNRNGFTITREAFCLEGSRVYVTMEAIFTPEAPYTAAQLEIGRFSARQTDGAAKQYIRKTLTALGRKRDGLRKGGEETAAAQLQHILDEIAEELP